MFTFSPLNRREYYNDDAKSVWSMASFIAQSLYVHFVTTEQGGQDDDDDARSVRSVASSILNHIPSPSAYEAKNARRLNMLAAMER